MSSFLQLNILRKYFTNNSDETYKKGSLAKPQNRAKLAKYLHEFIIKGKVIQ